MKISIDLDSTIADTIEHYCHMWNDQQGTNFQKSEITNWNLHEIFLKQNFKSGLFEPVTKDETYGFFVDVWQDWQFVKPTEDGLGDKIRKLQAMGHETWIITSQQETTRANIIKWLAYHDIPSKILCFVEGIPLKALFPCALYIDDYPQLYQSLHNKMQLLYDQPWNRAVVDIPGKVRRVSNFDEILRRLGSAQ